MFFFSILIWFYGFVDEADDLVTVFLRVLGGLCRAWGDLFQGE